MWSMYTLTRLTGRKAQGQRIITVGGFDAGRRFWAVFIVTLISGLLALLISMPLLGVMSIIPGMLTAAAVLFLLSKRSSTSRDRLWIAAKRDQLRAENGRFFVAGREVDPLASPILLLARSTVEVTERPAEVAS